METDKLNFQGIQCLLGAGNAVKQQDHRTYRGFVGCSSTGWVHRTAELYCQPHTFKAKSVLMELRNIFLKGGFQDFVDNCKMY